MLRKSDIKDTPPKRPPTVTEPETGLKTTPKERECIVQEVGIKLVEDEPVVVRARWGAQEPSKPFEEREGPPGRIFVVDTRTSQCKTLVECTTILQELQEAMIYEQGEDDLPYNFVVGGDGRVYEGRGWKAHIPLPTSIPDEYEDGTNFIIGLIGDFSFRSGLRPPEKMVMARREFVVYGKEIGQFDRKIEVYTDIQWKI